jgi:mRNA-degrading endonuclease YafQ of YafQ-DinJ toxin-antitoxin module
MRRLVWDASFRRAFKQRTRRLPSLQERILDVLETLAENPFEPEPSRKVRVGHFPA